MSKHAPQSRRLRGGYRRLWLSLGLFAACMFISVGATTWLAGNQPAGTVVELTAEEAEAFTLALTGASLPASRQNFWGQQQLGATTRLDMQFQSTRSAVEVFLAAAPRLPDTLDPAVRPGVVLSPIAGAPNWQPVRLTDTAGAAATWVEGNDEISVYVLTGRQEGSQLRDVYMVMVVRVVE